MTVLVVDDQINVVNGIVSGVDWESAGIKKVLHAYNAAMAREILTAEPVDILLCDIEMPVEDGLSLLRWVKGRNLPLECIFLTAHADFIYASEALKLGVFDYLLQPARYEDIRGVVQRAAESIQAKRKVQQLYSYGKAVYMNRDLFLQGISKDWFTGASLELKDMLKCFKDMGIQLHAESPVRLAALHLLRWRDEPWDGDSLYAAMENITAELMNQFGQGSLLLRLEKNRFLLFLYPHARHAPIGDEALCAQLRRLEETFRIHLRCDIACFTAAAVAMKDSPALMQRLQKMQLDNVSRLSGVFFYEPPRAEAAAPDRSALIPYWKNLLLNGCPQIAEEEISGYLHQAEHAGALCHAFLQQLCGDLIQIFSELPQAEDKLFRDFLARADTQDTLSHAAESLDGLLAFAHCACAFLSDNRQSAPEKAQTDRIIEYIHEHLSEDIRRSDIADVVYLNPDYLSRMFRKEKGVSLKEYILCEKMKTAQAILRSTSLPVAVVAARVGFENYSYFSQVYKKVTGINPSAERRHTETTPS